MSCPHWWSTTNKLCRPRPGVGGRGGPAGWTGGGYVHSRHLAGSGTEPWIEKWSESPTYVSTEHALNWNGLKM